MSDKNTDTMVWFGGKVKALGDGKVGGYLVRFSGPDAPDLEGDFFTAETDFGDAAKSPVYYQHGMDPKIKMTKLGVGDLTGDEVGIWIAAQLNMRDEYEKAVYEMAEAGKLGWSSGTASHLVAVEKSATGAHFIKHWPLGLDASLTPTPAEPRNTAVPLKSLQPQPVEEPAQNAASVETEPESGRDNNDGQKVTIEIIHTSEDHTMTEEIRTDVQDAPERDLGQEMDHLTAKQAEMDANVKRILEHVENSPKMERGGYVSNYGGKQDASHKSFGDWLLAVKRKDYTRLAKVYGQKDLTSDTGAAGGFLVPEQFMSTLLQIATNASQVVSRVTQVPVNSGAGVYPALDYSVTPTAGSGQTALASGVSAATTVEGAALTEDEPIFRQLEWRLNKVGGFTQASNELIADSPQAIEALLTNLFAITISNRNERDILRGSGAGEPLGILSADCTIGVATATNNVFAEADALGMMSRFKDLTGQGPVWIMHRGVIPDLNAFTSTSSVDMVTYGDGAGGLSSRLLGYPIIYSEHMPQDDNDDVLLCDLGSYLWFTKGGLQIAYSEHVNFTSEEGTWRFSQRRDGKPWLSASITLADPTGSYTVSPFVFHND